MTGIAENPASGEVAAVPLRPRSPLAWCDHGARGGRPVVFFHGWPSSRKLGAAWDATATRRGWRVFSPDRPGIGRSPAQPGRRFIDWPSALAAFLDDRNIARCPVIGMSGGGPYALVSAARLPERVTAAAVISGAPPLDDPSVHGMILPAFRGLAWLKQSLPGPTLAGFKGVGAVVRHLDVAMVRRLAQATTPAPDAAFFGTPEAESTLASGLEAWRAGGVGVHDEGRLYLEPWGFGPEEITTPVAFWHGGRDPLFHWSLVRQLARRVTGATFTCLRDAGHFTALYEAQEAVFDWLEGLSLAPDFDRDAADVHIGR